jgi:hypothetical protein
MDDAEAAELIAMLKAVGEGYVFQPVIERRN